MLRKIFTFHTNRDGLCHASPRFANRGGSKPWRGTARIVVRFAKKPNRAVAGRFAVCGTVVNTTLAHGMGTYPDHSSPSSQRPHRRASPERHLPLPTFSTTFRSTSYPSSDGDRTSTVRSASRIPTDSHSWHCSWSGTVRYPSTSYPPAGTTSTISRE